MPITASATPTRSGRRRSRSTRRRRVLLLLAAVVVLAVVMTVVVRVTWAPTATVTASSTAPGFDAGALPSGSGDAPLWRSDGTTAGTTLVISFGSEVTLDRAVVHSTAGRDRMTAASLLFDDTSSLALTPHEGATTTVFSPRTVTEVTLVVEEVADGATAVELAGLRLDDGGRVVTSAHGDVAGESAVTASSTGAGDAAALVGAARGAVDAATAWASTADDDAPAIELDWQQPRELTSVRLYGSGTDDGGVSQGRLVFDGGSTVLFAAVLPDGGVPTTVAFMPRTTTSLRVELTPQGEGSAVALRAVRAFTTGSSEAALPDGDGTRAVTGETAAPGSSSGGACPDDPALPAVPQATAGARILCPVPGTAVDGDVAVVVAAPEGTALTLTAALGPELLPAVVASGTTGADGRARMTVDADQLPGGPVNLRVAGGEVPLWVQLMVSGRQAPPGTSQAGRGMTLVYADEFDEPLSWSETGYHTRYTATKPSSTGPSEYGEAVFATPEEDPDTATTAGGLLRLRTAPLPPGRTDPRGWERTAVGAMLSSASLGGAGFSAQHAYFEVRALGAPGAGTWPAFWMLTTAKIADESRNNAEVDAFEMYGHRTGRLCTSTHQYAVGTNPVSVIECNDMVLGSDWALSWHTYGVRVTPTEVIYTTDGVETARLATPVAGDNPLFFMLTLSRGGGWPIDLRSSDGSSDMYVDWVRVYT